MDDTSKDHSSVSDPDDSSTLKSVMDIQSPSYTPSRTIDVQIDSESGAISTPSSEQEVKPVTINDVSSANHDVAESRNVEEASHNAIPDNSHSEASTEAKASEASEVPIDAEEIQAEGQATEQPKELFASDTHQENTPSPDNPLAITDTAKHKSKKPKAAIIVAIIIGILLIGVSVFAYMKLNTTKSTNSSSSDQTNKASDNKTDTVTDGDVDNAIKDVDGEINKTNDTSEIPASDSVSDQTLGL